jgi:hypothetical protein
VRSAPISPKQYRAVAAQCVRWAARAKSEEHRRVMLNMADHWVQIAQKLERAAGEPEHGARTFVARSQHMRLC